ncbi:MAG: PA0069 family radical SAM protein [Steroidobacteraceae bacterium]
MIPGHGALSNPAGRFETLRTEAWDDGWYQEQVPDSVPLELMPDRARSVISRNDSPDIPFEQSINPYRGCGNACIYCYARPSHAYLGLSPGLDFETRLFYKQDAGTLLEQELARPGYLCKPITLGANTDPYQPIERRMRVTREILAVLARCRHPVTVITKGALVLRDIDLLGALARDHLVDVGISITTLDAELKRTLEPQAASPAARLRMVRELTAAGVPTGVLVAPVIPALTDHEMERIVESAAEAVARWAGYVGTSTEASDPAGMSHLRNVRARQPRRRCVRSEAGCPAARMRVFLSLAPVRGPGYNISRTNDVPTAERAGSYARGVACAAEAANGSPFTRLSAAPRRTANRPKGPCKPQGLQGPRYGKCCLERHEDVSGQDSNCCACPTRWARCSASGSRPIIPSAPPTCSR